MENENKENVKSDKTRIPLPRNPIRPMPIRLIDKTNTDKKQRRPLKTLNTQATTSYRTEDDVKTKKITLKFSESIDYKVYRDGIRRNRKGRNPEKGDPACRLDGAGVAECNLVNLDEAKPNTPEVCYTAIEAPRIRNIKRSLKRPHSRELQGLSPGVTVKSESNNECKTKQSNLVYKITDRLKTPDILTNQYVVILSSYTNDIFNNLLANESKLESPSMLSDITRACLVNWIFKINGEDGDPSISQTACCLLDNFSSKFMVKLESLQVMGAACFWIAQKMKGPYFSATRLVKNGGYSYNNQALINAEMRILKALNFPNQPVIPNDFTSYLSWWCDPMDPGPIEVAASFIVLCGLLGDKSLSCVHPSVIGCAAVFNAILLLDKTSLIPRLLFNSAYLSAQKKTDDFPQVCKALRKAVIVVGLPCSEYRTPYEHYSRPPICIAKTIFKAAIDFENKGDEVIVITLNSA